ncbi:MAG: P-loop NTPase [Bdellovibrionales bacterium]|nr:P-loop NTPase [Bdellovibrionales bacterium]
MSKELPRYQSSPQAKQTPSLSPLDQNLARIKHVVAVSSGKGGVGKSTVSTQLSVALAKKGYKVGLLDADVYGPSIPKMLAGFSQPEQKDGKILPIHRHGVSFMSMGLLTDDQTPVIWRGPMATKLIQQFLANVEWGELDYLLIDLPPGTGDVQLTLTQLASLRGAVVVTSPQQVAVGITMRGIRMFDEVRVPILGLIENMSGFVCPHCDQESHPFSKDGGKAHAQQYGIPYLGGIPIDAKLAQAGDEGNPFLLGEDRPAAKAISNIVDQLEKTLKEIEDKTLENTMSPKEISSDDDHVILTWPDDHVSKINSRELRYQCPCAQCVSEDTGQRIIRKEDISEHIKPVGFRPVGRYGLQISWSDHHSTGIYTFNQLAKM